MSRDENTPDCPKLPGRPRDEAARARIQQAAIDLLIEGGFINLTCDAIAQRSGTSKSTIYRWWPNKVQVVIDAFIGELSPHLPICPADTLEEFVANQVSQFIEAVDGRNGQLLAAMLAAAQVVPAVHDAYQAHWLQPRREHLRSVLKQFQDFGSLSPSADIDIVLDALYGPLHMILMVQRNRLQPAYAEQLTSILLNGVRFQSLHR